MNVSDVPHHHTIDAYVSLLQYLFTQGHKDLRIWGEDMDAAYRQIGVRDLRESWTILMTPSGPSLWRHSAMMFGATASVWAFNRFADAVMYLARRLLVIANLHFVDDFGSGEPARWAESGCRSFCQMFGLLGLSMKPSKELLPDAQHVVLGVQLDLQPCGITLSPSPRRKEKMIHEIDRVLCANSLFPDHAQRIAGKLAFLTTTLFGAVGGAALQPLYARGHGLGGGDNERLTEALRAALVCLRHVLRSHRPRFVPWAASLQGPVAVMYTDAFFQMGEKKFKVGSLGIPTGWRPAEAPSYCNGWGFVLRIGEKVYYSCGTTPSYLLEAYCQRRAFIYFLEIAAVLIAAFNMRSVLPQFWVSFIDNHAGKFALQKGYGRDVCVNNLLSFFWAVVHEMGWFPHFRWVASQCNISDPISRFDVTMAERASWTPVSCHNEGLFQILRRVASDPEYAVVVAPGEALTLLEATIHAERCGVDLLGLAGEVSKPPPCMKSSADPT